jgi:hypothetical protein
MSDGADAKATLGSTARQHALSTSALDRLRAFLLNDPYYFTEVVCGHSDMVPEVHMAMSYAVTGSTDKLAWLLQQTGFDSGVTRSLKLQLQLRGIDVRTSLGRQMLDKALDWQNWRVARGTFKSSVITHGGATYTAVRDPNTTAKIIHAVDEKAWAYCGQIGETLLSGVMHDLFPERVPTGNVKELVTTKHITFGGRTISHPQTTLQASGYATKDIGGHYDTFWIDDLVVGGPGGNATEALLPGVHAWLRGLTGFYMNTRRVRQIHVGTRYHENDDNAFLTRGKNALECLTVTCPIEEHDGEVVNILERGRPTMPTLLPPEKITTLQSRVLSGADDMDGAFSWYCNYLLNPYQAGSKMFSDRLIDDPNRAWIGPLAYPGAEKNPQFKYRFLVARIARDEEGFPVDKDNKRLAADDSLRAKAKVLTFDPWKHLDRVVTLDAAWVNDADNWAVHVEGVDYEGVRFQLETISGNDGMEGWIDALADADERYRPRVIGFGKGGYQEPMVQNLLRTDKRLRKLRNKVVAIKEAGQAKVARIREGVAEPLKRYQLLLAPLDLNEYDGGAQATRDEMRDYRQGKKEQKDGILDAISMAPAVSRSARKPESADERKKRERELQVRRPIDPVLGVPMEGFRAA